MLECVILDMDGTLLDTETLSIQAWQKAGRQFGYELPADFITGYFGLPKEGIARRYYEVYGPDFPLEQVRAARLAEGDRYLAEHPVPVKPGAFELLRFLREKGLRIALATSTELDRAQPLLERAGLWPYFDAAVAGGMVPRGKPAPDVFWEAARRVGCSPEACLVVEDTENGACGALEAGCRVVIVPDLRQPGAEIRPRLHAVCPSLREVIDIVEALCEKGEQS